MQTWKKEGRQGIAVIGLEHEAMFSGQGKGCKEELMKKFLLQKHEWYSRK